MSFVIKKIWAFVAIDPEDGDEGIIGLNIPGTRSLSIPAIGADWTRVREIYGVVEQQMRHHKDIQWRVIELSTRRDVTDEVKDLIEMEKS